ncbi:MAG: DUF4194 domain-containing protein [Acidimicrobiales bacterium]
MSDTFTPSVPQELSAVVINLMKGPVYRDTHERTWDALLSLRRAVADYIRVMNLEVFIDEAEGYAFMRSRPDDDDTTDAELPRLVARRSLSFHVSVLVALFRKRMAEFDATSSDTRLVVTRDQIIDMLRVYLPDSTNEARIVDIVDGNINRVVELGFLRKMHGQENVFEVRRILKAFVDGQWLSDFDRRLDEYLAELAGPGESAGGGD